MRGLALARSFSSLAHGAAPLHDAPPPAYAGRAVEALETVIRVAGLLWGLVWLVVFGTPTFRPMRLDDSGYPRISLSHQS